jgi:hypothetical protein
MAIRLLKSTQLPYNKQLERTVLGHRVRAACASLHCAHAARWTRGHAAAQLRRWAHESKDTSQHEWRGHFEARSTAVAKPSVAA